MKIGMESDRVEDLDRELERLISQIAHDRFEGVDTSALITRVRELSQERIELTKPRFLPRVAA